TDQEVLDRILADVKAEIDTGVQFALGAGYPDGSQGDEDVYAEAPGGGATASHPSHREAAMSERELTYGEAVREAIAEEMRRDPPVFLIGEDVAVGGHASKRL